MEDNFINKIPNWLRYILAIPVGLIAVIIGYYIFYWSNLWVASPDSLMMKFCTFIYQNGLNVFILIGVIVYIVPKHQIEFAIVLSIIFCSIGFVGLGMTILVGEITFSYIIGFTLTLISFIVNCLFVFKKYYSNETINNAVYGENLNEVLHDDALLEEVLSKRKIINPELFLNKQNPYTGEPIQNYDDIINYLKMYQLDCKNINPFEALEKNKRRELTLRFNTSLFHLYKL